MSKYCSRMSSVAFGLFTFVVKSLVFFLSKFKSVVKFVRVVLLNNTYKIKFVILKHIGSCTFPGPVTK